MPQNDPDSLELVAGQVEALHKNFQDAKGKVTGVTGENPFGAVKRPDEVPGEHPSDAMVNALGSLTDGTHKQFDAAAKLMTSTGGALREAARLMRETDLAGKDSLTIKGQ